jgi:hypothetical protein
VVVVIDPVLAVVPAEMGAPEGERLGRHGGRPERGPPITMSTMKSKRRPDRGVEPSEQLPEAVVDRLAGLLPEEPLQDALKGLEGQEITGPGGLLSQLAGRVIQTALEAELTEHLGHPPGGTPASANVRNGSGAKTVSTDLGPVEVRTPRDRNGSLSPSWWPSADPAGRDRRQDPRPLRRRHVGPRHQRSPV